RRPRGRLPRARRADVSRRAGARRVVRLPLPRRAPDPGGRGAARRRRLRPRGSVDAEHGRPATLHRAAVVRDASAARAVVSMKLALRIWRQHDPGGAGGFVRYKLDDLPPDSTLLEALDGLNEWLVTRGEAPVAFDSDCREGICGACGIVVDGRPHGPLPGTTTCLLPLHAFRDGATITLEPFQTGVFPVVRDLVVDRSALDRVVQAGGYVSVRAGSVPDANALPVAHDAAERALDSAVCIGCGACVAACPNGSA